MGKLFKKTGPYFDKSSSCLTISSTTLKPPCQKEAWLISKPASIRIFMGGSEPPVERISM